MTPTREFIYVVLFVSAVLAAAGQVAFKLGASGRTHWLAFCNGWIVLGLACYLMGTLLWIFALSRASLTVVYPFTALTFVLVFLAGVLFLGEATTARQMGGVLLVLAGLYVIAWK